MADSLESVRNAAFSAAIGSLIRITELKVDDLTLDLKVSLTTAAAIIAELRVVQHKLAKNASRIEVARL